MSMFEYPEGATPLDPEEIDGLKIPFITTREELNRVEFENIQNAHSWFEKKRSPDVLSEKFLCELHKRMFGEVWDWAGKFRRSDKNIGCSWVRIGIELRQLLDDVKFWIDNKTYPEIEIAYRFHHRLVFIHLFSNGNGRHARLATDILLSGLLKQKSFSWGNEDINSENKARSTYIAALRAADNHDYSFLAAFLEDKND